ncbi:nucleotide exchange factor GrpE [Venenivibrio stagnispumantis]|uniref:Protein GrpE n=1 Tax=Venenivibrio stagnispumantis TaxID=407998 RepID=A0AA45WKT6_9AQUI|nr:nucleotide exchange factor GrpE [Venenivibrio stagnispumantis]MCW4573171.1 nucleotide exchange factor GrpE [Venenivibrio stagnispumantis]SMP08198.1 molecular chaperone GrpE [Venenivibrio stagnispumantis]
MEENKNNQELEIKEQNQEEKVEEQKAEQTGEPISLEEIEALKKENEEIKKKLEKTEEAAKRLSSLYQMLQKDFEDFKLKTIKEKEAIKEETIEKFAKGLLDLIDNFERALESFKNTQDVDNIIKGIQMIHYQLISYLKEYGIEKIEASGEFNPQEHEALETIATKDYEPNQIVKVLQSGYKYKGKVIRPARVSVSISVAEEEIT